MTLGQLMGRLVREGLDRHDPARPPRGRRTDSHAAGAEQTSAAKTQAASSAQAAGQPGDAASPLKADLGPEHPDTSAAKPAGDTTSAPKQDANADSAAPSAAKVSAQATGQPGDEAASRLQIDHVVPYAQGGAAEPNNLRLLCAAHHRHRHAGTGFGRPG